MKHISFSNEADVYRILLSWHTLQTRPLHITSLERGLIYSQGIGNAMSGLFGGVAGAGATIRTGAGPIVCQIAVPET